MNTSPYNGPQPVPGFAAQYETDLAALHARLAETEQLLSAIRNGEVDALVVGRGGQERVYTLETADTPYRHFVEHMQEGAVALTGGIILYANRRFSDLVGVPLEQMVGRAVEEFLTPREALQRLIGRGADGAARDELELVRRDAPPIPVAVSATYLSHESAGRLCLVITDLRTTRQYERLRQKEAALRSSEERYRSMFEQVAIGIVQCSRAGELLQVNPGFGRILGVAPELLRGRSLLDLVHPEDRERARAHAERVWNGRPDGGLEQRLLRADGGAVWVQMTCSLVRDAEGRPAAVASIVEDISARKALESQRDELLTSERAARAEVERASRAKDDFLATLSHELRTPLSAVLGWAQMLQRDRLSGAEAREALAVIEKNAQLQKKLIEDLLDMSRIISGKLRLDMQPVEIAIVAREALASFRLEAEAQGLRLEERLDVKAGQVLGDAGRLRQALCNVLSNALKFTPAGGSVRVTLRSNADRVLIAIKDTGVGIARDFLPHLFERFRQADSSTTRKYRGLGLGLSIVRQIVELHGGTVRARSRGAGHGTTVVLELPRLPSLRASAVEERMAAEAGSEASLAGVSIIVVDDEPSTLDFMGRMLRDAGATAVLANNAADAIQALETCPADVLISDISMPGEDGYDLLRRVRGLVDPERARIPAIAVTAFVRPEDRRRALAVGYQAHLGKPIEGSELVSLVSRLARKR